MYVRCSIPNARLSNNGVIGIALFFFFLQSPPSPPEKESKGGTEESAPYTQLVWWYLYIFKQVVDRERKKERNGPNTPSRLPPSHSPCPLPR